MAAIVTIRCMLLLPSVQNPAIPDRRSAIT
jgi:hypothetical protein